MRHGRSVAINSKNLRVPANLEDVKQLVAWAMIRVARGTLPREDAKWIVHLAREYREAESALEIAAIQKQIDELRAARAADHG